MIPKTTFVQKLQRSLLLMALLLITYPMGLYFNAQKLLPKLKAIKLPSFNFNRAKMPDLSIEKIRSAN